MLTYTDPTQEAFDSAQQVSIDVLAQSSPTCITKTGSVIKELVVRPLAYLLAWAKTNLDELRRQSSIAYLKTSQATENEVADLVASNYFVERRQGTQAKGIVTLTLNTPSLRLAAGSTFTAGGVPLHTETQYMITAADITSLLDQQTTTQYLRSYPTGEPDRYYVNVPVVTDETGKFEIPEDSDVTIGFASSAVVAAELTSPITGGSDTETDAQLMERAEYNTAEAGVGTYYGLLKRFLHAPVSVSSIFPVQGEETALYRARYNTVNINPGGIIDCYIKTTNQPHIELCGGTVALTSGSFTPTVQTCDGPVPTGTPVNGYWCEFPITDPKYSGLYTVQGISVPGWVVNEQTVQLSAPTGSSTKAARLSTDQLTTVKFFITRNTTENGEDPSVVDVSMNVVYMPGLYQLQRYIDSDTESFIGLDVKCKAAVPVCVHVNCSVTSEQVLSEQDILILKQAITDTINALPVGTKAINFSDLRNACASAIPGVDLRLPCAFTGYCYRFYGNIEPIYSTNGILDITVPTTPDTFDYTMCYFYTCNDFIRLGVL